MKGLIPAAGRGLRAWPKASAVPKVMLEIDGKPILQRNIEILRDCLGIRDITIIVGFLQERIRECFGDGGGVGVSIRYLECRNPDIGLARGMLLVKEEFREPFVTILGDELYSHSNHHRLLETLPADFEAVCGLLRTDDLHQIKRNYSVEVKDGRIARLVEKPTAIDNDLLGCGTYVFSPAIFAAIESTEPSPRSGRVELTDAIGRLERVYPFLLEGEYFNVNTIDDFNFANFKLRESSFAERRVSVVIPAYNEEQSIGSRSPSEPVAACLANSSGAYMAVAGLLLIYGAQLWGSHSGVGTLKSDPLHAAGVVLLALVLARAARGRFDGAIFAFAVAFATEKYTGAMLAALAAAAVVLLRARLVTLVGAAFLFAATTGHYYIRNLWLWHNPFYPFTARFARLVLPGTGDLSATSIAANWRNPRLWRLFFLPERVSPAGLLFPAMLGSGGLPAGRSQYRLQRAAIPALRRAAPA
jgi:dTDP-glucose pyrophosphorylase